MANYLEEIEQLSLSVEDLIDAEPPIIINTLTRNLEIQNGFNTQIAVEGDLSANEITFECDRHIEGYDVYSADSAYIIWKNNAAGTEGAYLVNNRALKGTGKFQFSWLLSREVAKKAGTVECSICFIDYAEEDRSVIAYKWASNPLTSLKVGVGLPNTKIDDIDYVEEGDFDRDPAEVSAKPFIYDLDSSILLSLQDRNLTVNDHGMNKQIAVAGDCYSSVVSIAVNETEVDFNIRDVDIALIKWKINGKTGYDILYNSELGIDLTYDWLPSPELTKESGQIEFSVCFINTDEADAVISRWNSNPCSALSIGRGMYNSAIDDAEKIEKPITEGQVSQEELTEILKEVFEI